MDPVEGHFRFAGVHAQNHHIFTPPVNRQWCMVWGATPWIAECPWAHWAYDYSFQAMHIHVLFQINEA